MNLASPEAFWRELIKLEHAGLGLGLRLGLGLGLRLGSGLGLGLLG